MDEKVQFELPLPALTTRQACNAEDPLSSVHNYLYCAKVVLPAALGMRMCMNCPHCNCDENDPNIVLQREHRPCQDVFGHNSKLMGGYAGMAQSLGIGNEFQGDGSPHGHALVSLANLYQHKDLSEIAKILEDRCNEIVQNTSEHDGKNPEDVLERIKTFLDHVCREDHIDHEAHVSNIAELEKDFAQNNVGRPINDFLANPFFDR